MAEKVALIVDGGFVKKKLQEQLGHFPSAQEIVNLCRAIMQKPRLQGCALFRVYFYDAPPLQGTETNPIDGSTINFSNSPQAKLNFGLIQSLELQPDFAVRKGFLSFDGWKLGHAALKSLSEGRRQIEARDLVPDISQKGVDMRMGLDVAWISLKRIVDAVEFVTGDSDFVPAMKFARREGLRVYLEHMGHSVKRELKVHTDFVL